MKITTSTYLTADTHFGHSKLFEIGERTESFNEEIVSAWNKVVNDQDTVLHLGDLTMVNKQETIKWTRKLMGKKYLVLGNHDKHSVGWYADCGFTVIPDCYKLLEIDFAKGIDIKYRFHLLFTHEPVTDLPVGWYNIHGHLHGNDHRGILTTENHFDVGADPQRFKPVSLEDVLTAFKYRKHAVMHARVDHRHQWKMVRVARPYWLECEATSNKLSTYKECVVCGKKDT